MSKGQKHDRRARKRGFVAACIVVAVMTAATPAMALLGINITVPLPAVLGLPSITVPVNVSVPGILGITNLQGGLTQTQTTLTQLVSGLQKGANVATPFVQAHATAAAGTAIENLQDRLEATAAAALAVDPTAAQSEIMGVVSDLQAQALGEVAGVLPLALTTGLQVVQDVVSPVCSLTAVPTSFVPGVGLDLTRTYKALAPVLQQVDMATDALIQQTYKYVYDSTLASVNNIPNVGPIVSALLTLLKFNWTTSYTPPGSTTPIVTTTPALIDVPTPLNVDGSTGLDLCATLTFALEGSGTSITGIKFTQTITKMPLAKPTLPVDVMGGLLNVLNLGYDTTESTAPIVYTTSATVDLAGLKINLDNNYAVHRGTNLTIPPVILGSLTTGGLAGMLPIIPALTTPAPKPIVTQKVCIGECSALALKYRYENVPTSTHVDAPLLPLTGTKVNYTGAQASDGFSYRLAAGTTGFATVVGRDRAVPDNAADLYAPAVGSVPTNVAWCYDFTNSSCSPAGSATDKSSIGIAASGPTFVENFLMQSATDPVACSSSTTYDSHINTGGTFNNAHTPGTTTVGSGRVYVDTGGKPASGCVGMIAGVALGSAPLSLTLPTGFSATARNATYHTTQLGSIVLGVTPDAKTGQITCPAGTGATWTSLSPIASAALGPIVCSVPPVNTVAPAITGSALIDSALTASNGTWTPGSPNAPTFAKQWQRCDAAGTLASCVDIVGATGNSYVLDYGSYPSEPTDWHHTFRVKVTGTNLDDSVAAYSVPTALVELPPPPVNTAIPVLGSNRKVGVATTTSDGTWNPGAGSFAYQWELCSGVDGSSNGTGCADISGATGNSYTPSLSDESSYIRVGITGTNHGGTSSEVFSKAAFIPPPAFNVSAPGIKNGPSNAVGAVVLTGDNLTAQNGLWMFNTAPFTYQWQLCDGGGGSCADISGATAAIYNVALADAGHTLRVGVTGSGVNGGSLAYSGTTGVIIVNDLSVKPATQVPDGTVNASAAGAGGTAILGGAFDTVGAPTGGSAAAPIAGTGSPVSMASLATGGPVKATQPDGSGGYFLGGSFTKVQGFDCAGLAHIASDGSLDQAYCGLDITGDVRALSRMTRSGSSVLAVGGAFTKGTHSNLLFIDTPSMAVLYDAVGDPNGAVNAITTSATANTFYVGGDFSQLGGAGAGLLGSEGVTLTGTTATAVTRGNWTAGVCNGVAAMASCTDATASVKALAWYDGSLGDAVVVGGKFSGGYRTPNTDGTARNNAVLFAEGNNPTLYGWNPNLNGQVNAIAVTVPNGLNNVPIFLGGEFTTVNGANIPRLAEFGVSTLGASAGSGTALTAGPMTGFVPAPNGPVTSLAWSGSTSSGTLVVGGAFTTVNTGPVASPTVNSRHRLAMFTTPAFTGTTVPLSSWDPNAGRTVLAVSRDATNVFVGGDFNVVGGVTRNNLAQIHPSTGVTSWNPGTDGEVKAVAVSGGNVYVGGTFANAGGAARANLAQIDATTGTATSWNPGADGAVNAIALGGNVYVGGAFANAGGAARANLAAIDGSGAATGWNPGTDGAVNAIALDSGLAYVGGSFAHAGGAARNNAAAIDGSGFASAFDPNTNGAVNAIVVDSSGVYLGGVFTTVGADGRMSIAIVDPVTGAVLAWNPGTDGSVSAIYVLASQVFVGGSFGTAGGAPRANLAALDAGSDFAQGFAANPNGSVRTLTRTSGNSLTVGGSFTMASGSVSPGLAFFGG